MRELSYALAAALIIAIYHFLKRLFAKGKIIDAYIIENKSAPFVLLLIDYATTMVSKGGISKSHRFKFKKIDLQKFSVQYEEKITGFTSDMIDGFVHVLGMNEQFSFIVTYNYDLIVFDIIHGKIICNKKKIIKRSPNLAGFDPNSCVYSDSVKSIIIFDDKQNAYFLDTETFIAKQVNFDKNDIDKTEKVQCFDDLPSINIDKQYLISDPIFFFNNAKNYSVDFISDKGSKRYFISIENCGSDEKANVSDKTFLSPTIVKGAMDISNILIVHLQNLNPEIKDINVSRVDDKGKQYWQYNIAETTIDAKFSKHSFLYFSEFKNRLYFIYVEKSSGRLSVSTIDIHSGELIHMPKLFN